MLCKHAHDEGFEAALAQYKLAGWGDAIKGVGKAVAGHAKDIGGAAVRGAKSIGSTVAGAGRDFGGAVATAGKDVANEVRTQGPALLDQGREFLQGQAQGLSHVGTGLHAMLTPSSLPFSGAVRSLGKDLAWGGAKKLAPTAALAGGAYLLSRGGDRPAPQQQMQQPQQDEQQMHPQYANQLASLYPAPRY